MHGSVILTICLCLSVPTFAAKTPSKYSIPDEISSTTKDEAITETVTITSRGDGHMVPEPEVILNEAPPTESLTTSKDEDDMLLEPEVIINETPLTESVATIKDEDINLGAASTTVPVVESTDVPSSGSDILSSEVPKKGSRILFLAPVCMYSHTLDYLGVAETLASNGHQITMVSSFPGGFNKPYLHREVVLPVRDINDMLPNLFQGRAAGFSMLNEWVPLCIEALATQEVQDIKKEEFDLILLSPVMSECFWSVMYDMQIPFVYVYPNAMNGGTVFAYTGTPNFLSFTPSMIRGVTSPPDGLPFTERLITVFADTLFMGIHQYFVYSMDKECRALGLCSPDMPYLYDIAFNSSLLITNSIRTMDPVGQPMVQSVVYAGGIHLKNAEPLPEELEQWVQSSGEAGFIYVSFGSLVKPSEMPEEYRQVFLKAFSSLDQKVLWKWDQESMADRPDNLRISKWLPQQDLLGHPKLSLFITHGGLHSTTEAMHSGVPVLGIPIFGDQFSNMAQVQNRGWGKPIDWNNFTAEALVHDIHDVTNSQSMKTEAMRLSKIMKDQIITPKDNVNYWIDYVIRHKGAYHLKCPATYMPWYRLYNVDVWLSLGLILTLILCLACLILRSCWRCLRPRKHKTE